MTEWQKDALEDLEQEYRKEDIVRQHVLGSWGDAYDSLNRLSVDEIVRALYSGYEVEPEYKIGDWVARIDGENFIHGEKVVQVTGVSEFYLNYGFDIGIRTDKIRHATPEEIKAEQERRVWAKTGRKFGEFKDGDIGVCERIYWNDPDDLKNLYKEGILESFYPVESRISFGGGEDEIN